MKKEEMAQLGVDALQSELNNSRRQLFELRLKKGVVNIEDFSQFKKLRKNIARILTFIRQKTAANI